VLFRSADIRSLFPKRRRRTHKGDYGHLLIIAGSEGYTGAPVLCAHAAARAGAGLVTLAVPRDVYSIIAANCPPEIMPVPFDRLGSLAAYNAVALGPGLGQTAETQRLIFSWISTCPRPLVLDADALNALARNSSLLNTITTPLILTPHPGEMARLTAQPLRDIQTNRWETARRFAQERQVILVLKGPGTIITDNTGHLWINSTGNPGMAKGGMGDALTGIIGALLAQGITPLDAARAGVFFHGSAGDIACKHIGERTMSATDLIVSLSMAFRNFGELPWTASGS
jgi:NAD(P)H-hydrate epimerase